MLILKHALITMGLVTPAVLGVEARANEVVAFGVSTFDQCSGESVPELLTLTSTLRDQFTAWQNDGLWDKVTRHSNASVDKIDWADASKVSNAADGADPAGADHADVAFLATHGARVTNENGRAYSRFVMGDGWAGPGTAWEDCRVFTDRDVSWGNTGGDLEIVIAFACQSVDFGVWTSTKRYFPMVTTNGAFSTYLGFHGVTYASAANVAALGDFLAQSLNDGIGDNWLDFMYDPRNQNDDSQCPTVITFGASTEQRKSMFQFGGFSDRKNTGLNTGATFHYVSGCDPAHSDALPS